MQYTTPSLLAVATGIIGSAWASGAIASATFMGVSALIAVPASSAQTWREIYARGAKIMPKVALLTSLSLIYSAYDAHTKSGFWTGYAGAAASVLAIVPWTIIVMKPTNDLLTTAAEQGKDANREKVVALMRKWNVLNSLRSCFPLIGTGLAFITLLHNIM